MSRRAAAVAALLLAVALAFPWLAGNQYLLLVACITLLYAAGGLAWNLLGGYAGQLSLGHGVYFGIGAYTSSILFLHHGVSPWLGMPLGGLLGALASLLIGYPCFRLRGPYYVMATIGLLEVFGVLGLKLKGLTNGAVGLTVSGTSTSWWHFQFVNYQPFYYFGLLLTLMVLGFTLAMDRRKMGYYLRAIREDEDAAEAVGIDTLRCKLWAAAWSGFFTALCGTFYAQLVGFIDPPTVFGFELSLQVMLVAYIGGASNPYGPLVGSLLVTPLSELLRSRYSMVPGLSLLIYGLAIIVIMLWLRQGLVPACGRLLRRLDARRQRGLARGAA